MSGTTGRRGFIFSDIYILNEALAGCLDLNISVLEAKDRLETTYGVEAAFEGSEGEWDVLVKSGEIFEIQEVKSGGVASKDRKIFWLRIRRTISDMGSSGKQVLPRMVINTDKKPASYEAWKSLSNNFRTYTEAQPPTTFPQRVLTSAHLTQEALYWICTATEFNPGEEEPKAIPYKVSFADAMAVLQEFKLVEVSESNLRKTFQGKLAALFDGVDPIDVQDKVCGWIARIATDPNNAMKFFTPHSLISEVEYFKRFIDRPTSVVRLAQFISEEAKSIIQNYFDSKLTDGGIGEIPIETTQPSFDYVNKWKKKRGFLLLGEAGQGKSVILCQLAKSLDSIVPNLGIYKFRAADLSHVDQRQFETDFMGVIRFLSDIETLRGNESCFVIDEFDQAPHWMRKPIFDSIRKFQHKDCIKFVVSCRLVDWTRRQFEHPLEEFVLQDWDESIVKNVLEQKDFDRQLTPSLMKLIRIPFYLDLLVRTFSADDVVPKNLETRHGLLNEFWVKRVLSNEHREGSLELLKSIIESENNGLPYKLKKSALPDTVLQSADYLISIGVLSHPSTSGIVAYRHPLFVGFFNAQFILDEKGVDAYEGIKSLISPVLRWNTHRAVVEAICEMNKQKHDTSVTIDQYIGTDPVNISDDLADILGAFHNTLGIRWHEWDGLSEFFGERLLRSAKRIKNILWLDYIASWPISKEWCESRPWMTLDFFRELYLFLKDGSGIESELAKKVAFRLRSWSLSPIFDPQRSKSVLSLVVESVVKLDPSRETIVWIKRICRGKDYFLYSRVLESLNILLFNNSLDHSAIEALVGIYEEAIGLYRRDDGFWGVYESLWQSAVFDHQAINWSLIGSQKKPHLGLLKLKPKYFLKSAVKLIEACWLREKERKIDREKKRLESIEQREFESYPLYREELTYPEGDEFFYDDWPRILIGALATKTMTYIF